MRTTPSSPADFSDAGAPGCVDVFDVRLTFALEMSLKPMPTMPSSGSSLLTRSSLKLTASAKCCGEAVRLATATVSAQRTPLTLPLP